MRSALVGPDPESMERLETTANSMELMSGSTSADGAALVDSHSH